MTKNQLPPETAVTGAICESCFLEPRAQNDTGLYNPGGPCSGGMEDLLALLDFMKQTPGTAEHPRG